MSTDCMKFSFLIQSHKSLLTKTEGKTLKRCVSESLVSAERFLLMFECCCVQQADKIDVPLLCQTDNVIKVVQPWPTP